MPIQEGKARGYLHRGLERDDVPLRRQQHMKMHLEVSRGRQNTVRRHHLQLPQRGPGEGTGEQLCPEARQSARTECQME